MGCGWVELAIARYFRLNSPLALSERKLLQTMDQNIFHDYGSESSDLFTLSEIVKKHLLLLLICDLLQKWWIRKNSTKFAAKRSQLKYIPRTDIF